MTLNQTDLIIKAVISKIKDVRLKKNYKQAYIASQMGCSQNAYSKIELGQTELTLKNLIKIAKILEINLVDLLSQSPAVYDQAFIPQATEAEVVDKGP